MSSFTLLYTMSSISKMRPENIKLMSTVAVFFCDVAFRLEPDKGPLYVQMRLSDLIKFYYLNLIDQVKSDSTYRVNLLAVSLIQV